MSEKDNNNSNNIKENINNNNNELKKSLFISNISNIDQMNPMILQLTEFGFDNIFSRRVFHYLHPEDIDEALNYMAKENGIIHHRYIKNRRDLNNILCYICGEKEEIHLKDINISNNVIKEEEEINESNNKSEIKSKNSLKKSLESSSVKESNITKEKNLSNGEEDKISYNNNIKRNEKYEKNKIIKLDKKRDLSEDKKIECEICNDKYIVTDKNKVNKCGHSFCDSCWFDSLSIKIKENKLSSIKCLDYNCKEKLDDEFIINLINSDNDLIKKYKRYKTELLIINDPNKKLCPFPDCDSYLELKDIRIKEVSCLNNHKFCFECLQKPHGKLPCDNRNLFKSIIEFAESNLVKKCPNCSIIIEKNKGCNHITCSKCGYQWCWLCNQKYLPDHFKRGKCFGFQFFQPKDNYDIKLAMEGKINAKELSDSQRQFNEESFEEVHGINIIEEEYNDLSCAKKFLLFLIQAFFGQIFFVFLLSDGEINKIFYFYLMCYIIITIAFFFPLILVNIIIIILRLLIYGFKNTIIQFISKDKDLAKKITIVILSLNIGSLCTSVNIWKHYVIRRLRYTNETIMRIVIFFSSALITIVILYPQIIIANIFGTILVGIADFDYLCRIIKRSFDF